MHFGKSVFAECLALEDVVMRGSSKQQLSPLHSKLYSLRSDAFLFRDFFIGTSMNFTVRTYVCDVSRLDSRM